MACVTGAWGMWLRPKGRRAAGRPAARCAGSDPKKARISKTMGPQARDRVGAPVRIALCITDLAPGGAEQCLVELATRMDRGQFEPVVYSLAARPAGNSGCLAETLARQGIGVHYFDA